MANLNNFDNLRAMINQTIKSGGVPSKTTAADMRKALTDMADTLEFLLTGQNPTTTAAPTTQAPTTARPATTLATTQAPTSPPTTLAPNTTNPFTTDAETLAGDCTSFISRGTVTQGVELFEVYTDFGGDDSRLVLSGTTAGGATYGQLFNTSNVYIIANARNVNDNVRIRLVSGATVLADLAGVGSIEGKVNLASCSNVTLDVLINANQNTTAAPTTIATTAGTTPAPQTTGSVSTETPSTAPETTGSPTTVVGCTENKMLTISGTPADVSYVYIENQDGSAIYEAKDGTVSLNFVARLYIQIAWTGTSAYRFRLLNTEAGNAVVFESDGQQGSTAFNVLADIPCADLRLEILAAQVSTTPAPVTTQAQLWRILVDPGESNNKTTGNWNNITEQTPGKKANNPSLGFSLIDTAGTVRTGIEYVMVNSGQNSASIPVGTGGAQIPVGDYPLSAVKDYFVISNTGDNLHESEFAGLPDGLYDLGIFASRGNVGEKREGLYSINNGSPVLYEAANNTSNILWFRGIRPVAGKINIKIQANAGSDVAYLNVLDLTRIS